MSAAIGYMVVVSSPIPSEPPKADWDGEIHPTREQAEAECAQANSSGSEPDETPDDSWRVVAVVEADAIAEAEKRGAVKALARVSEEIDEDKRYPGFDLVMWLTGLQNGIESGEVTLP